MKKLLIILGVILLIIVLIPIAIFLYILTDDKDYCLDMGICKEGLELNTEYGLVKINKENCLKYNWRWRQKSPKHKGYCDVNDKKEAF